MCVCVCVNEMRDKVRRMIVSEEVRRVRGQEKRGEENGLVGIGIFEWRRKERERKEKKSEGGNGKRRGKNEKRRRDKR